MTAVLYVGLLMLSRSFNANDYHFCGAVLCAGAISVPSFSGGQLEIRDALYLTINNIFCCDAHGVFFLLFCSFLFAIRQSCLVFNEAAYID